VDGTTVEGVYSADTTNDLDILPMPASETEVDLGTISVDENDVATGTAAIEDVFNALGLGDSLAFVLGLIDDAFQRYSTVDVDGNDVIDFDEGKEYDLYVDFEFDSGSTFEAIQSDYNDLDDASLGGYMYYFMVSPDDAAVDFETATIAPPAAVTTDNPEGDLQCYNVTDESGRVLNFYCGGGVSAPVTPPAGTYTITADLAGGEQAYTFENVASQTIADDLEGIFLPSVKLTMSGDSISLVEWQWYKRTTSGWEEATDSEIESVMESVGYEIDDNLGGSVLMVMDSTASGSSAPDDQDFTPTTFRVSYTNIAGFCYGMEWR
jgi:hypothetical protein